MAASKMLTIILATLLSPFATASHSNSNFDKDIDITWGDGRAKTTNHGKTLSLSLDPSSGSGFQSKHEFLYGKFDVKLKLVPGNSAGTVTTFYLSSKGSTWDELDFEFLGNSSGEPYIVHTNVYTQGQGNREQQFYLWFDPTAKYHTYSVLWNPGHVVFSVDGKPIRVFRNMETSGVAFPKSQPMRVYGSLWNADDWATRGGLVKTNWSEAPFVATFKQFKADACVLFDGVSSCDGATSPTPDGQHYWLSEELDSSDMKRLKRIQSKYMVYNYCTDVNRFPQGLPFECNATTVS